MLRSARQRRVGRLLKAPLTILNNCRYSSRASFRLKHVSLSSANVRLARMAFDLNETTVLVSKRVSLRLSSRVDQTWLLSSRTPRQPRPGRGAVAASGGTARNVERTGGHSSAATV